jgi:hypothetical protein
VGRCHGPHALVGAIPRKQAQELQKSDPEANLHEFQRQNQKTTKIIIIRHKMLI